MAPKNWTTLKFIYSEKATKFCEIFTLLLSCVMPVKSKLKISQNFVALSDYMNFSGLVIREKHVTIMLLTLTAK